MLQKKTNKVVPKNKQFVKNYQPGGKCQPKYLCQRDPAADIVQRTHAEDLVTVGIHSQDSTWRDEWSVQNSLDDVFIFVHNGDMFNQGRNQDCVKEGPITAPGALIWEGSK